MSIVLPKYDSQKKSLPQRRDFVGAISWLQAVQDYVMEPFVFALDEALMCMGCFLGRCDEYIVWGYGPSTVLQYNDVVLLGNDVNACNVEENNGLLFTNFSKTLNDVIKYESVLDMQGITEALNCYYYTHGESFAGITIRPEYQKRFQLLAKDAVEYYDSW